MLKNLDLSYSTLYNSAGTEKEMEVLRQQMDQLITPGSTYEVAKITGNKVKSAICTLKPRKSHLMHH